MIILIRGVRVCPRRWNS